MKIEEKINERLEVINSNLKMYDKWINDIGYFRSFLRRKEELKMEKIKLLRWK